MTRHSWLRSCFFLHSKLPLLASVDVCACQVVSHIGGPTRLSTVYASEALATQYISENTTIPVPPMLEVIALPSGKGNFLLMTGVKGKEYGPTGVTEPVCPPITSNTLRLSVRSPPRTSFTCSHFANPGSLTTTRCVWHWKSEQICSIL